MAQIEDHCKDCKALLGKQIKIVHLFLDQYSKVFDVGTFTEYHRTFLHNKRGISLAQQHWGRKAGLAAKIHIVRDYYEQSLIDKDLKWVEEKLGKALIYFNNNDNLEPQLHPSIVSAWGGKSLCCIAFEQGGHDEYLCDTKEL